MPFESGTHSSPWTSSDRTASDQLLLQTCTGTVSTTDRFSCGESLPLFVFSPHCVCCWLLLPPSSPFPHDGSPLCKSLHLLYHRFMHSPQIILDSRPSSRCYFCFGLLVCCHHYTCTIKISSNIIVSAVETFIYIKAVEFLAVINKE